MRGLQVQFFASPAEQYNWLARQLKTGFWCCIQGPGVSRLISVEDLQASWFEPDLDDGKIFYMGNFEISPPRWREANGHVRLDHVRSGAIQFAPGIYLREKQVLLEGRLAHPDLSNCVAAGLAAETCEQWFREMFDSFKGELGLSGAVLYQLTTGGTRKLWPDVWVTSGASEMHRKGVKLKQFADGPVEFGLLPEGA